MKNILMSAFYIIIFSSYLLSGTAVAEEAKKQEPKITFSKINDNFWVLHGGNGLGSNVGMSIGDDGIVLIDAMNIGTGKKLIKAIRSISDKPIKYVINTHQHGDHRGGNEELVAIGATIIYPDYLKYTTYPGVEREIQFKDKMTFKANGEIFTLYHVISHTWNDVIVHMKNNNAVFTGDNHATSWGPNIGAQGLRGHREIFDLIIDLSDEQTLVVPGHTRLADLAHVKQFDQMVQDWYDHVLTKHRQGISAESIINDKKIKALLKWFHDNKMPEWLNPERQLARVAGTIFSDDASNIELPGTEHAKYLGKYQLKDGSIVEIFNRKGELIAYKDKFFIAHLMPRSLSHFDFNGWNEKERLDFKLDDTGKALSLTYSVNDKVEFSAIRVKD